MATEMAEEMAVTTGQGEGRGAGGAEGRRAGLKGAVAFGAIAVVVLGAAFYFLWPVFGPGGGAVANAVTVQLSMVGFDPPQLSGRVGEPLTLNLVNNDGHLHVGGGWHQFAIDDFGVDVKVPPRQTRLFTFTPTRSGTYDFYCDVCCGGRDNPSMHGTLVVEG